MCSGMRQGSVLGTRCGLNPGPPACKASASGLMLTSGSNGWTMRGPHGDDEMGCKGRSLEKTLPTLPQPPWPPGKGLPGPAWHLGGTGASVPSAPQGSLKPVLFCRGPCWSSGYCWLCPARDLVPEAARCWGPSLASSQHSSTPRNTSGSEGKAQTGGKCPEHLDQAFFTEWDSGHRAPPLAGSQAWH